MAPQKNKHKKRLTAHTALMIFTLFALACSMVAWFTNSKVAKLSTLQMQVENRDLVLMEEITNIQFFTSTKIADTTKALFNSSYTGCIVKTYTLQGSVSVTASVECSGPGMLAYVCHDDDTTDYYTEITEKLTAKLGSTKSNWTYAKIKSALAEINKHTVSKVSSGNTPVKIVYWVEYEEAKSLLNKTSYWDSAADTTAANQYKAKITFST